jgi:murein DD-endopeptidase MepM/ murein hydrolase activator NlpD
MEISIARPLANGKGTVSQWFGEHPEWYKKYGQAGHAGLDYAVAIGTPVLAAQAGKVTTVANDPTGYGLYVRISNGVYETIYAHLSKVLVKVGDAVSIAQPIGLSGNSGNSTGPHLHMSLRISGMRNPAYSNWIDMVPFRGI